MLPVMETLTTGVFWRMSWVTFFCTTNITGSMQEDYRT